MPIEIRVDSYNTSFRGLIQSNEFPENVIIKNGLVRFKNIVFTSNREIEFDAYQKSDHEIIFENYIFRQAKNTQLSNLQISNSSYPKIRFKGCSANQFHISNCKDLHLEHCSGVILYVQNTHLQFSDSKFEDISFGSIALDRVNLSNTDIENVLLSGCNFAGEFAIQNTRFGKINIEGLTSEKGKFIFKKNQCDHSVSFKNFKLDKCSIQDNTGATFELSLSHLDSLSFYRNKNDFQFDEKEINSGKINSNSASQLQLTKNKIKDVLVIEKNKGNEISILNQSALCA